MNQPGPQHGPAQPHGEADALVAHTHHLPNLVRTTQAPDSIRVDAIALLSRAASLLAAHAHAGPYAVEQLAPPGDGRITLAPADRTRTAPYSPLLGRRSPTAPPSSCQAIDGVVHGRIRFSPTHAGPMGPVHGACIAALFDEILALSVLAKGEVGYTRSLEVSFARPTPLDAELEFSAECTGREGNHPFSRAQLTHAGKITASAVVTFAWPTGAGQARIEPGAAPLLNTAG